MRDWSIETYGLTKEYKGKSKPLMAVDHIDLSVRSGELFGLLGPNGAGKTTLIKMLCTLILPTEGTAKVGGYDIVKDAAKVRETIGWLHGETGGRALYWRQGKGGKMDRLWGSRQDTAQLCSRLNHAIWVARPTARFLLRVAYRRLRLRE